MRFLGETSVEQFRDDEVLVSAVERRFEIVGEAIARALRIDPSLAEVVPEAPQVVGFRNVLAHGYDSVSAETVFGFARTLLPDLVDALRAAMARERGL